MAVQADGLLVDGGLVGEDCSLGHKTALVDATVAQKLLQAGIELVAVRLHAARAVLLNLADQRLNGGQAARNIGLHFLALDGAHGNEGVHGLLGHGFDILPQLILVRWSGGLSQHVRKAGKHPDRDVVFQVHPLRHGVERGAVALGQLPVDSDDGVRRCDGLDGKAQLHLAAADLGGDELFQLIFQKCAGARQARGILKKSCIDAAKFHFDVTAVQQRTRAAIPCHAQNHNLTPHKTHILYIVLFLGARCKAGSRILQNFTWIFTIYPKQKAAPAAKRRRHSAN